MMKNALRVFGLAACISLLSACSNSNDSLRPEQPPNIIFFILDLSLIHISEPTRPY